MSKKRRESKERKWDRAYNAIADKVVNAIFESGMKSVRIAYSAFKEDRNGIPIDNLDDVAVQGTVILVRERSDYFGGPSSESYYSRTLESPTWLTVCLHANASISKTRDKHHFFVEAVRLVKKLGGGISIYEVVMGS